VVILLQDVTPENNGWILLFHHRCIACNINTKPSVLQS